jgi:hypothetical protein
MPALGLHVPDTDKINSTVPRASSPLHNQDYAWSENQVKGTPRAGVEPWGFAALAANQHFRIVGNIAPKCCFSGYISVTRCGG